MFKFTSEQDLARSRLPPSMKAIATKCLNNIITACHFPESGRPYDPENDGYVIVLEKGEDIDPLPNLNLIAPISQLHFDHVEKDLQSNCFVMCYFTNNQFGITFILPDDWWLSPRIRERLINIMKSSIEEEA